MDIKAYISSGILESYVMGLTTPEENGEVERYALIYPEIKTEISLIEESIARLADSTSKIPAPELKDNIFARIRMLEKEEKQTSEPKIITLSKQKNNHILCSLFKICLF